MKTRKLLSLALALVMVLALLPTAALADGGEEYYLTGGADDQGAGWSWDHAARTLTLNGYDGDGFKTGGDLTIELAVGSSNYINGQINANDIVVQGTGSLVIDGEYKSGEYAVECDSFTLESGYVEIKNCPREKVEISAPDFQGMVQSLGTPIWCRNEGTRTITVKGGTLVMPRLDAHHFTADGGAVILTANAEAAYGHVLVWVWEDLTLRNCTLTLAGTGYNTLGQCQTLVLDHLRYYRATDPDNPFLLDLRVEQSPTIVHMEKDAYSVTSGGPWYSVSLHSIGAPTAYPSTQKVNVDGKAVEFQCYALKDAAGNDTNYIKLRDLADILNNSAAQFQVGWDNQVTITTGQGYTKNGTEQHTPFSGQREYKLSAAQTLVDGAAKPLAAFTLTDDAGGGYTYYKLRDLGAALGFKVDWSAEKGIFIETK